MLQSSQIASNHVPSKAVFVKSVSECFPVLAVVAEEDVTKFLVSFPDVAESIDKFVRHTDFAIFTKLMRNRRKCHNLTPELH
ncbi:hypothetical protein WK77_16185 [Burkholderia ubonensis]|nr:hypothetical protein WK77_16185 [Burkholderia ubonensis]